MDIRCYLGGIFLCVSSLANACSCVDQKLPMSETLAQNDFVFTGKVIKKSKEQLVGSIFYDVEFQLTETYKGKLGAHAVVKTGKDSAMCGFPFEEGESYLVFAYKLTDEEQSSKPQMQYGTGLCSKTKAIKYAEADLQELNKIKRAAR